MHGNPHIGLHTIRGARLGGFIWMIRSDIGSLRQGAGTDANHGFIRKGRACNL